MQTSLLSRFARLTVGLVISLPLLAAAQSGDKPFNKEQLDQLTAQVALYPDSLLAQLFMATTYDEFALATAWSKAHPDAKGDDAVKMVENAKSTFPLPAPTERCDEFSGGVGR